MAEWTVWSVEDDLLENTGGVVSSAGCEAFDVGSYSEFLDAFSWACEERRENPAAVCVYITRETGNVWYALDCLTGEGVYPGPGVKSWRAALALM